MVIHASFRSDGNTSAFAKNVFSQDTADFVDLNELNVGYLSGCSTTQTPAGCSPSLLRNFFSFVNVCNS
jgi:hypothetical protein